MHDLIHEASAKKIQPSVTKLELLLESIEEVSKVNDTITIKFKDNVVIASKKSIVLFAVDYLHLDGKKTFLNTFEKISTQARERVLNVLPRITEQFPAFFAIHFQKIKSHEIVNNFLTKLKVKVYDDE